MSRPFQFLPPSFLSIFSLLCHLRDASILSPELSLILNSHLRPITANRLGGGKGIMLSPKQSPRVLECSSQPRSRLKWSTTGASPFETQCLSRPGIYVEG